MAKTRKPKFTMQSRIVQAVSSYVSEEIYDSKDLVELRKRIQGIGSDSKFWQHVAELEEISKSVPKFMIHWS